MFIILRWLTLSSAANTCHVCSVIPAFKSAAEQLLNNSGLSAVELLAKALAKAVVSTTPFHFCPFKIYFLDVSRRLLSSSSLCSSDMGKCYFQGYTEVKNRSLLTSMEGYVTLILEGGKPMFTPS